MVKRVDYKIYTIPDIHGEYDLLYKLINILFKKHKFNPLQDKLVFLGDYIDRGPKSKEVLEYVKGLTEEYPDNIIALRGNHEGLMLRAYKTRNCYDFDLWYINGGLRTLQSYHPLAEVPEDVLKWIAALPLYYQLPGFFFSHAPLPKENWREIHEKGQPYTEHDYTWTYSQDESGIAKDHGKGTRGVCGHIHALRKGCFEPRIYKHYIYADAGCGCHKKAPLVAIEVQSQKIITIKPEERKHYDYT